MILEPLMCYSQFQGIITQVTPYKEEQDARVFTEGGITIGLGMSVLALILHPTSSKMEIQQQMTVA